jgi:DNA segregation ATPase FtsK/SpoIIIE-like protein
MTTPEYEPKHAAPVIDPTRGVYSGMSTAQQNISFPELLTWEDTAHLIAETDSSTLLLGVDGQGEPVTVDLDDESPHVLISGASGGGKSGILRACAMQALIGGAQVVFLDLKRHSHRWAKNLNNTAYAASLPEVGNALVSVGAEVHRRNQVVDDFAGPIEEAPVGDRIVVVFEEMNATMSQLQAVSKRLPDNTYTAMDALRDIMFMGRAAKVHLICAAQFADARSTGGSEIRENFATRILTRYTKNAWSMLAYDCGLPQAAPEERGRGMVCRAGKAKQTQFLYITEEEAADIVRTAVKRDSGMWTSKKQAKQAARALHNDGYEEADV